MGTFGKIREIPGKVIAVQMPKKILEKIEQNIDMEDGIVDADVVMSELKISKKSLSNMIASGKLPKTMYTVAVNGVKKFFIYPILGLNSTKMKWKRNA